MTHFPAWAQDNPPIGIGDWRSHLAYRPVSGMVETQDALWVATANGLFRVGLEDRQLTTFDATSPLNQTDISKIQYDRARDLLFIIYDNGIMDVVTPSTDLQDLRTYSDIERSDLTGLKAINDLAFGDPRIYVAFGQGVLEYDPERNLTLENYLNIFPGTDQEAVSVAVFRDSLFVAGNNVLLAAPLSANIDRRNPNAWTTFPGVLKDLTPFNGQLYAVNRNTGRLQRWQNQQMIEAPEGSAMPGFMGQLRKAHGRLELLSIQALALLPPDGPLQVRYRGAISYALEDQLGQTWVTPVDELHLLQEDSLVRVQPNGPYRKGMETFTMERDRLIVAGGNLQANFAGSFSRNGLYILEDGVWTNKTSRELAPNPDIFDYLRAIPDPNQEEIFWCASYTRGVVQVDLDTPAQSVLYDQNNATVSIQTEALNNPCNSYPFDCPEFYHRVPDLAFDSEGILWALNHEVGAPLLARDPEGNWYEFALQGVEDVLSLAIDRLGQIWCTTRNSGLVVYNRGEDLADPRDDQVQVLGTATGSGNLPTTQTRSLVIDREGAVWVGTADGVAAFFSPSFIFGDFNFDAQPIILTDDNFAGRLLEGQVVNNIAVDGANRKWFATNSGVWVTNSSGDEVLLRFTAENSPLPSDAIADIGIQPQTGEVFIATDEGIYSYRSEATEGRSVHREVLAFPNPVRPGYNGPIAVRGLVEDADVRITDASGRLVTEGAALGGQFVWNGRDLKGRRVNSGVYLVFSSDREGAETAVIKILIVR